MKINEKSVHYNTIYTVFTKLCYTSGKKPDFYFIYIIIYTDYDVVVGKFVSNKTTEYSGFYYLNWFSFSFLYMKMSLQWKKETSQPYHNYRGCRRVAP